MPQDKRISERHKVRFHLVYDDGASFNAGTVRDVSETGLFLETALPLAVGTEVRLTPLDGSDHGLLEIRARVTRTIPYDRTDADPARAGMGLQFLDLSDAERAEVVKMIGQLQADAAHPAGDFDPYLGVFVPSASPDSGSKPAGS